MNRKSTLHIITGLSDGGAEAVLYRLCKHDTQTRHQVVSLMDAGKYGPLLEALGVEVTCLNMPRGGVTASGLWRLWRTVRAASPDAVQTWMYHANLLGGLVARLAGRRNVVWGIHNTTLIAGKTSRATILVARTGALLCRLLSRRIACCAEKSVEVHAALGYDRRRMVFIPNGYDLNTFKPDAASGIALRTELRLGTRPVIAFVARHDPQKDHENLLQALARMKARGLQPDCLLVGSGLEPGNAVLTRRVAELGLEDQIWFLGRRDDVSAIMNAIDLHVMSSSFGEAFPNVLAEAMACGTPCVSTDVGDAAGIIGDTGWIAPPRDPEALAEAMAQALSTLSQSDWVGRQAAARRRIADCFSIERMAETYRAVWFGKGA